MENLTYAVWLADVSDVLDQTKLLDGTPIVPGDYIVWRLTDEAMIPIQAYESETDANFLADNLNGWH